MIKLLLNENFPAPSVRRLEERGLDIIAIREACPGWKDEQVLARAADECIGRFVVFTREQIRTRPLLQVV